VANKLSLNLLKHRLACTSQLSLKGVIATNLVVNFWAELGKLRQERLLSGFAFTGHHRRFYLLLGISTIFLFLFKGNLEIDIVSELLRMEALRIFAGQRLQLLWHETADFSLTHVFNLWESACHPDDL
jgi:hypothetical protein